MHAAEAGDQASPTSRTVIRPARRPRPARRFLGDRRGATAVEFAFVGPVFLALLCAIIEVGLTFWAGQILETALTDASRQIYTGSFQAAHKTGTARQILDALRTDQFCKVNGQARVTIFTCANVKIDVKTASQFPASGPASPLNPTTKDWATGFGDNYTSAAAGDIVVVQAAVKFPVFFSFIAPNQASFSDGSRLLQAAVAFKTEPF